jgi:hypothetical protein
MIRTPCHRLGRSGLHLLAVLIVCLAPTAAQAMEMVFRNDCRGPVVVHSWYVVRGRLYRNKPYLLRCGQSTPKIKLLADMVVSINDGKVPNRVLFQSAVRATRFKQSYRIVPDPSNAYRVRVMNNRTR